MTQKAPETENNQNTPLSAYVRNKKVLTPPLATIPNFQMTSWVNDRLPEMLWAALIRVEHSEHTGILILRHILVWLSNEVQNGEISGVRHSDIAVYPEKLRRDFIYKITELAGTDALKPLLLLEELPGYNIWKEALNNIKSDPKKDMAQLGESIVRVMPHQSQAATDVRWVKLMGMLMTGKINFTSQFENRIKEIEMYPDYGNQGMVRSSIRSMEMMDTMMDTSYDWASRFWKSAYESTGCIFENDYRSRNDVAARYDVIDNESKYYRKRTKNAWASLHDHYFRSLQTTAIDSRHEAVFGISLFAVNTFIEMTVLQTSGGITGRVATRIIFEAYINLAYLLKKEREGSPLWDAYREYGVGQFSLIDRKFTEEKLHVSLIDTQKMTSIVNEDKWSEFVPINIGHWDGTDLRSMSIEVGAKKTYDKYYPYTSSFIHAHWGAVRETALQSCVNPLHRYHRVPNNEISILMSASNDCRLLVNKILKLVDIAYPGYKYQFRKPPNHPS